MQSPLFTKKTGISRTTSSRICHEDIPCCKIWQPMGKRIPPNNFRTRGKESHQTTFELTYSAINTNITLPPSMLDQKLGWFSLILAGLLHEICSLCTLGKSCHLSREILQLSDCDIEWSIWCLIWIITVGWVVIGSLDD